MTSQHENTYGGNRWEGWKRYEKVSSEGRKRGKREEEEFLKARKDGER